MRHRSFFLVTLGMLAVVANAVVGCAKDSKGPTQPPSPSPPVFQFAWGSFGFGDGQFNGPWGVAADQAGYVYVSDTNNHRVQKFTEGGGYVTTWYWDPTPNPIDLKCDPSGFVWVLLGDGIRKFSSNGDSVGAIGFRQGSGPGQFSSPTALALEHSGDFYITDFLNHRVQRLASNGAFLTQWGSEGSDNGQFQGSYGIAVDASGNVYVSDYGNHRVQKFTANGAYLTQWGTLGSAEGQFKNPTGVAIDAAGRVLVADYLNTRVQAFANDGRFLFQWRTAGGGDGQFSQPFGVGVGPSGSIYVTDHDLHCRRPCKAA